MERRNPASSKDNGGLFTGLLQMYGRGSQTAAGHGCFPGTVSGGGPPQTHSACHKAESSKTAYLSDLTSYMDSFPADDSSNPVFAFEAPSRAQPEAPRVPSEALLDAISVAQRRLQHLELFVRMMIQGRGQPHMPHQHHSSMAMEFASIMSQLSAATADLTSPPPFQPSSLLAPLANDTFDFGFDAFSEEDLSRTLGEGSSLPGPSASGMDVMLSGSCQGLGLCLPSWAMDVRAMPAVEPTASPDEVANIFTTVHAQGNMDESTVETGTPADLHGKANCALESDNQTLLSHEEHREEEDDGEDESLPPGSYELMELAATEILAEHTHFCEICGKGFKRDANLRMHMRGHGDEYKTAAALARPDKLPRDCSLMKLRRYSCPYAGCKRNKKHPKFQPLKTMLCVKNHYRRSHCPKVLVCSRCKAKKFSVNADLKTHEKHCGQDKWQCSCGTTFSRKDKLYGHIGLFAGHTPATLAHEAERAENLRSNLKGLASSCSNSPQAPANVKEDNVETSDVDGSQGLGVCKMPVTVGRTHESDKGSIGEQSLNEREKAAVSCVSKVVLSNESSFHLSASSTTGPDGSGFDNLMSDGVDCKARAAD